MEIPNFEELYNHVKRIKDDEHGTAQLLRKQKLKQESEFVKKVILDAASKGKHNCIIPNYMSSETVDGLKSKFKVERAYGGLNPSTHDPMELGWKISW